MKRRIPKAFRVLRIFAAGLVLTAAVFGVMSSTQAAQKTAAFVSSLQLFPATVRLLRAALKGAGAGALAAGAVTAALYLLSAVFGRWYCGVLCPLGTLQDMASFPKGKRRVHARPVRLLRAGALVAVLALLIAGAAGAASVLDPWAIFSRTFTHGFRNLIRLLRNEDLPGFHWATALASAAAFTAVIAASFFSGRWFCGNLCPVGSVLGALNAGAPLRVRYDKAACISCGACSKVCRASCINVEEKRLDPTRCVNCLACLPVCPADALYYGRERRPAEKAARIDKASSGKGFGLTRAQFIRALVGGVMMFPLAALTRRYLPKGVRPDAALPVVPPGGRSIDAFLSSCVACGLCISRCPSKVLQPAVGHYGLAGFMSPRLDYDVSYCQFDCTLCTEVCPSGALERLGIERKHVTKIGDASLVRDKCVVFTNHTKCGACAEHCPTGAVRMVVGETGLPEPVFTSSICIGCGACHHACPVEPEKAITVSGLAAQGISEKPSSTLFGDNSGDAPPENEEEVFPF